MDIFSSICTTPDYSVKFEPKSQDFAILNVTFQTTNSVSQTLLLHPNDILAYRSINDYTS